MIIEIELSDKLSKCVPEIIEHIKKQNPEAGEVVIEDVLTQVCKERLIQIYAEMLNSE